MSHRNPRDTSHPAISKGTHTLTLLPYLLANHRSNHATETDLCEPSNLRVHKLYGAAAMLAQFSLDLVFSEKRNPHVDFCFAGPVSPLNDSGLRCSTQTWLLGDTAAR